ncbi:enoyl-CoA hydratase [Paraburkholderia sp. WC7.3g]|uniref:Enoyl-CoA hydratase/isomerase family protein n=1 Tax=Paraburkholderia podalyriae TaxID=1938811 RepID=A0ABR7PHX2_9BURK|nr:enoyl-CoA hydratase/isomerase family protein [Paraburkholderia podalyriae]MBC8745966.1 enoyl-CoA hydratase/isomerase family protein [Paraburkholderia podalyriae]
MSKVESQSPTPPTVLVDDSTEHVRIITLNRPERMNSFDGSTLIAFKSAIDECAEVERDVRVIVIRGAGRAFCAGNDLKWLASGVINDVAAHMGHQDLMQATFEALEAAPQIVIACVHGFALAGGFELALSCDILIVDEQAEMGDEHIRRNLLPGGGGSQRLPRKLGLSRALFYLLTGRRMTGIEAERIGLASLAVPAEKLEYETMQIATGMAQTDARALASMKSAARRGLELPLKEALWLERWTQYRYRIASPALADGVQMFATRARSERE